MEERKKERKDGRRGKTIEFRQRRKFSYFAFSINQETGRKGQGGRGRGKIGRGKKRGKISGGKRRGTLGGEEEEEN